MRANGSVRELGGLGRASHLCWPYDDPAHFHLAAETYIAEGFALGERVACIGEQFAQPDVVSLDDAYGRTPLNTPEEKLQFWDEVTHQALADGCTGLRVIAEVTPLAMDPGQLDEQLRWEHLADDYIANGPGLSAICAYRTDILDDTVIRELACRHPQVREPLHPVQEESFRLFFDGDTLVLAGILDSFNAAQLERLLAGTHVQSDRLVVDASQLEFVDGRGTTVFAELAIALSERNRMLRITGASTTLRKVWRVLGYSHLPNVTLSGAGRDH
jgi:anti-anti-sigma regulatory factor